MCRAHHPPFISAPYLILRARRSCSLCLLRVGMIPWPAKCIRRFQGHFKPARRDVVCAFSSPEVVHFLCSYSHIQSEGNEKAHEATKEEIRDALNKSDLHRRFLDKIYDFVFT
ncbi:hypothetical protein SERLA73DRAFT_184928 [Serpula lacrymans var. lacrymans S7.3]|uniref:Uncharacterized protein n=2 Tax=Serpula lacrymans var. lacrymans TaxID=341189 RepID=F8Q3R4_SERL3|nr:uncharacterized protein SERLADRAFT_473111 [Serpula lacrymans var. lacrymans S7.9]EGN96770.1 hypothetical protein SERLA73DRAFT_184928 [Serpula lacrymans var. lacrymans S7.3]EGO22375.1 hypothetical protein SERLADRAFT_473111 [Serpula lacrymans var. lacrymans S7.9]